MYKLKNRISFWIVFLKIIIVMVLTSCSAKDIEDEALVENEDYMYVDSEKLQDNASDVYEDKETVSLDNNTATYDFSVITVGTGTPEYSEEKASACTLIQYDGSYIVVDCGDGSNANMLEYGFGYRDIDAIFFTHHHIDHTADFFDIYIKCLQFNNKIDVVGPPRTKEFINFVSDVYLDDILYRKSGKARNLKNAKSNILDDMADVTEIIGQNQIEITGITITTAEMTHTMYNLAYRFDLDGKSVVVSGDTSYDENLITLAKDADILVIDGALYRHNNESTEESKFIEPFYEYGGDFEVSPHMTFDDIVNTAIKANVKKLVIIHYGDTTEERIDESISKIKEKFDGEVIYAYDMQEISVE